MSNIRTGAGYTPTDPQHIATKAYVDTLPTVRPLARTTFTGKANSSWTVQDSGQAVTQTGSSFLSIISGALTHAQVGAGAAGYAETNIGQRLGRMGATFQIPDITKSGTITFVVPLSSWVTGGVGSAPAGCHFYCTATAWAYQVYDGSALSNVITGTHSLSANVDYDLEIVYEGTSARIVLPDGTTVTATHPLIGSAVGNIGLLELYEQDATAVPIKVSSVRIDGLRNAPFNANIIGRALGAAKVYADLRTPKITVSTTAPSGPAVGDVWIDTN